MADEARDLGGAGRAPAEAWPAPGPVAPVTADAGPDRILEDVVHSGVEVWFVLDEPSAEALLVEVPFAPVPSVEPLRVQAQETVHAGRDLLSRRLDQEVIVRAHQAPGVHSPVEHLNGLCQQLEEVLAVDVVEVEVDAADAAGRHVKAAVLRKKRARSARHVAIDGNGASTSRKGATPPLTQFCYRDCPWGVSDRVRACFRSSGRRRSSASGSTIATTPRSRASRCPSGRCSLPSGRTR